MSQKISRKGAAALATALVTSEPCRICGEPLRPEEVSKAIYVGYDEQNRTRLAHEHCYRVCKDKELWALR